jgi:hypothetical protein
MLSLVSMESLITTDRAFSSLVLGLWTYDARFHWCTLCFMCMRFCELQVFVSGVVCLLLILEMSLFFLKVYWWCGLPCVETASKVSCALNVTESKNCISMLNPYIPFKREHESEWQSVYLLLLFGSLCFVSYVNCKWSRLHKNLHPNFELRPCSPPDFSVAMHWRESNWRLCRPAWLHLRSFSAFASRLIITRAKVLTLLSSRGTIKLMAVSIVGLCCLCDSTWCLLRPYIELRASSPSSFMQPFPQPYHAFTSHCLSHSTPVIDFHLSLTSVMYIPWLVYY